MVNRLFQRVVKVTATAVLTVFAINLSGVAPGNAVATDNLFFSINASDSGSYSSGIPGTWRDLSTAARNGTIHQTLNYNGTTGALEFPNTGRNSTDAANAAYVDMGSGFANFGTGITIEFEAHFGAAIGPWERIFDFGNGQEQDNFWVGNYSSTDEIAVELWRPNPSVQQAAGRCRTADSVNAIASSTFKKYVITLDGSECRMYVNGTEVNTVIDGPAKAIATNNPSNSGFDSFYDAPSTLSSNYAFLPNNVTRTKNYIGRSNWSVDAAFDGAIKYVRFYTGTLTPTDVQSNATTYTLTYATTGSETGTAPTAKNGNGLVTLDGNTGTLTKTGHTFQGWAASPGQTTAITGSYNLTSNSTLYPAFAPNSYAVTYNSHGGSSITDGSFTHGSSLTYPTNPTKNGYRFQGWYAAATGGSALTASAVAAANAATTLHAQWIGETYNVTYDEHGGSAVLNGSYVFGETLVYPSAPHKLGEIFGGWFAAPTGGSALTASAISTGTSDVILHAQWTPAPAQIVTWNPNNTSALIGSGALLPSTLASSDGDGEISYAVHNAGSTGCSVNSSTGTVTFIKVGSCTIRATATTTYSYLTNYHDVTFEFGSTAASSSLRLNLATGSSVTNGDVFYGASGLEANSPWSIVLQSTPQTVASGTFTGSVLSGDFQIPAGLEAGWHTLTFNGTAASGSAIKQVIWFKVSTTGTMLQQTSVKPAELATGGNTGLASTGYNALGQLGLATVLALAGLVIVALRRTRKTN